MALAGISCHRQVASGTFDATAAEAACRHAPLTTLPVTSAAPVLRADLERWFSANRVQYSMIANDQNAVDVSLPPGCHIVANGLRRAYGTRVSVHEGIVVRPS